RVFAVRFAPDGKTLASGGGLAVYLWDVQTGKEVRRFETKEGSSACLAFSPDGKLLAGPAGLIWDVASGKRVQQLPEPGRSAHCIAFSPDGKVLATGSGQIIYLPGPRDADNIIHLWDIATGKEIRRLAGHTMGVTSVEFSPDGRMLASGTRGATVRIWEV